jgi:putative membrane protein
MTQRSITEFLFCFVYRSASRLTREESSKFLERDAPFPCYTLFIGEAMNLISTILIIIVALLHLGFLYLEMFLWDKPFGMKTFRMTEEQAKQSKSLAMNQGLYNGFLAAGLIWSLFTDDSVKIFFLVCVIIAGIFGAMTVSKRIFYIQALPAILGLAAVLIL